MVKQIAAASLGTSGHLALAAAAVSAILFVTTWVSLSHCRQRTAQLSQKLQELQIAPSSLELQDGVLRNLTVRVRTVESALEKLRGLEVARRAAEAKKEELKSMATSTSQPAARVKKSTASPVATSKSGGASNQKRSTPPAVAKKQNPHQKDAEEDEDEDAEKQEQEQEDDDDEIEIRDEETEEEAEKRRQKEYEEQLTLIQYNPKTKKYMRWRPDARCGMNAPSLPDDGMVECNPKGQEFCCSSLGWCGATKQHCKCGTCVDYRYVKRSSSQQGL